MNTPVSFNIAKLLKEKGFDGNTYYDTVGWRALVWYHIDYKDLHPYEFFGSFNNMVKAPTISDVVMWIYEKHKIWIWVSMEVGYRVTFCWQVTGDSTSATYKSNFKTPTDAYTAAIEYTLKKLIK